MLIKENGYLDCEIVNVGPKKEADIAILWMHGLGANSSDFLNIIPLLNFGLGKSVKFIFPQAPIIPITIHNGCKMAAWFDIYDIYKNGVRAIEDITGINNTSSALSKIIDRELKQCFLAENIFIVGFSQGGAMALRFGLSYEKSFRGILNLSGYLPASETFPDLIKEANKKVPILITHGTKDDILPYEIAEKTYKKLQSLGCNVKMLSYDIGHYVSENEISDINLWFKSLL